MSEGVRRRDSRNLGSTLLPTPVQIELQLQGDGGLSEDAVLAVLVGSRDGRDDLVAAQHSAVQP